MRLVLFYLFAFFAIIILLIALLLIAATLTIYADYGFSTKEMGRDALGYYSGFGIISFILMVIGLIFGYFSKRMWREVKYKRLKIGSEENNKA